MAPKIDQGTIIILDIGRNVAEPDEKNEKSFFEKAKECATRIIERKIMSQTKSYVGIILLGSKTRNNMANQFKGLFRRIEVLAELQAPTWKMIHEFPKQASSHSGDWVDAVIVATDHFQNGVFGATISNLKIILMTNFKSPTDCSEADFEKVVNGLQDDKYEVDVIGLDLDNPEVVEQFKGEDLKLAQQLVTATNGATASFDHTMSYLLFHKKRAVKAMPWNVDLEIGPNIKIPVSSYIRLKSEPILQKWMKAIKDPVTSQASKTEAIVKSKVQVNVEKNHSIVDPADTIKGYHYGQRVIPFSDCDKSLLYESGDKCLSVYGFTYASNISWQNLKGDGLSYVFGRKGDQKAQYAVRCLVECLHELNLIGIVRRVYNKNNAPKMYALMPVIDTNNYVCLSMAELCFEDDIKYMAFPQTNLKKYACSDEQVNAFKELINAMDLTRAYDENFDDSEAFPIAETFSPAVQYVMDCISFRAMNPGQPLPQPNDEIMNLFKVPALVEKRSRDSLEKIKTLFTLNKVEVKPRKVKQPAVDEQLNPTDAEPPSDPSVSEYPDMPKIQLPKVPKSEDVNKIGTIDPVGDFTKLAARDKPLTELALQMSEAIENLFYCNLDGIYAKPLDAMIHFRKECVKTDPFHYNNWLLKFKGALMDRKKFDIISLITEKKVNFILKTENSSSTYESEDSHEESQLYENDTIPNSTVLSIRQDVNDMFDEM